MKKKLFWSMLPLVLSACSSISYLSIETRNPGEVTFPNTVQKVMVVNNAKAQPDDSGYTYSLLGVVQDTARMKADSALVKLCTTLGLSVLDASYFEDVLLFHDPLRDNDTNSFRDIKLTQQQVQELCRSNGVDALISLDKAYFTMDRKDVYVGAGYVSGEIFIDSKGILRAYLPDKKQPIASVLIEDSVRFEQVAENQRLLNYYLPSPSEALTFAAEVVGTKVSEYFVPHWTEESRWYYNGSNSRWKEASAYAASGKWNQAADVWEKLFLGNKSKNKQAQIASNIALCKEMQTDLKSAYDWSKKSYTLFKEAEGDKSRNTELLKVYSEVLEKRILAEKKLNVQIDGK